MTLHIVTVTPNHVVSVSDRLIATSAGYRELDNDSYKHLLLITDDARVIISFAGFAGILGSDNNLKETTIDWLTHVIQQTSGEGHHRIDQHLTDIRDRAKDYIHSLRNSGIPPTDLCLTILASGWVGPEQFNCVIDNCLEKAWRWSSEARPSFKTRVRNYAKAKFEDGSYVAFLGNERLGMKQRALRKLLALNALDEEPKKIFDTSVKIIRAAAAQSKGSIGVNCSGIRISRSDPGIEAYDDRNTEIYDMVMPNFIISKSRISSSITNVKGRNVKSKWEDGGATFLI